MFRNHIQHLATRSAFGFGSESLTSCVGYIFWPPEPLWHPSPDSSVSLKADPLGCSSLGASWWAFFHWVWPMAAIAGGQVVLEGESESGVLLPCSVSRLWLRIFPPWLQLPGGSGSSTHQGLTGPQSQGSFELGHGTDSLLLLLSASLTLRSSHFTYVPSREKKWGGFCLLLTPWLNHQLNPTLAGAIYQLAHSSRSVGFLFAVRWNFPWNLTTDCCWVPSTQRLMSLVQQVGQTSGF